MRAFSVVYPKAFPSLFSAERKRDTNATETPNARDDDDDSKSSSRENLSPEPFLLGPKLKPARGAHHREILAVVRTEIFPA